MATLGELRTEAKELADEAGSTFVTDTQWDIWLNAGARKLARIVLRYNKHLLLTSTTLSITNPIPGSNALAIPSGAAGIYVVEKDPSTTSRQFLRPIHPLMKNCRTNGPGYWRDASNVYVEPAEQSAGSYKLWYIAGATTMTIGVDLQSSLEPWREYIEVYAAIRAVAKDKLDTSELRARLKEIEEDDIAAAAANADGALNAAIIDVEEAFADGAWDA